MIRVSNLSFRYAGRRRPALRDVSFSVEAGEAVLVTGASGSGKSTLALCLNGLIPQLVEGEMAGEVVVDGLSTATTPVSLLAQRVGLMFQDPDSQLCTLTVEDEVAFGPENLRLPPAEIAARVEWALEQVGLRGMRRARLEHLSGGTKQRVALASALAMRPAVLVLDEPTAHLDPRGTREVFAALARLRSQGTYTFVIVEHKVDDLGRALAVDRTVVLPHGPDLEDSPDCRTGTTTESGEGTRFVSLTSVRSELSLGSSGPRSRVTTGRPYLTTENECDRPSPLPPGPLPLSRRTGEGKGVGGRGEDSHTLSEHSARAPVPLDGKAGGRASPLDARLAVEVSDLSYTYPAGVDALRGVTLQVPAGDFLALLGHNAAGKTTLAKHLVGLLRPPPGRLRVFGRDASRIPGRDLGRMMGFVFQNPEHGFVEERVYDEVAYGLRLRGVGEVEVKERVTALLREFGLAPLERANPFTLSQGQKRRLSVAAALVTDPPVLVLDEPTLGQDPDQTGRLMGMVCELNRAGRTVVFITHDMRLVAEYARSAAVLAAGRVIYRGPADELWSRAGVLEEAELGLPPEGAAGGLQGRTVCANTRRLADSNSLSPLGEGRQSDGLCR